MTVKIRNHKISLEEMIASLPKRKRELVVDFLLYLNDREEWKATWEIMKDKKLRKKIELGKKAIKEGKWVRWKDVKRGI